MTTTKRTPLPIVLKVWAANDMAEIWQGKTEILLGNSWDFHPGCYGTVLHINGKRRDIDKEWNDAIRGPHAVANLIARLAGAELKVQVMRGSWS